jgi:restriction system protein
MTCELAREALVSFRYLGASPTSSDLIAKLRSMNGSEFERFVADAFRKMGYAVEVTGGVSDHGVDLLMRKDDQLIAVQCKCWSGSVGEPVVRDFWGSLMNSGAQFGYIVTTSSFTDQALAFAQGKSIGFIDLDALVNLAIRGSTNAGIGTQDRQKLAQVT